MHISKISNQAVQDDLSIITTTNVTSPSAPVSKLTQLPHELQEIIFNFCIDSVATCASLEVTCKAIYKAINNDKSERNFWAALTIRNYSSYYSYNELQANLTAHVCSNAHLQKQPIARQIKSLAVNKLASYRAIISETEAFDFHNTQHAKLVHQESSRKYQRPSCCTVYIVMLGSGGVGKTTFVETYVNGRVSQYDCNIEDRFVKQVKFDNDKLPVELQLLDTAGQEEFKSAHDILIIEGSAYVVMYDITDMESFNEAIAKIRRIENEVARKLPIFLVGNKYDLSYNKRIVSMEQGQAIASKFGIKHAECSAKDKINLDPIMKDLALMTLQYRAFKHKYPKGFVSKPTTSGSANCITM